MEAVAIAQAVSSHVNTIYSDLQAFEHYGVECIRQRFYGGAPVRITEVQQRPPSLISQKHPLAKWGWPMVVVEAT